jgi:methylamine---glutamate N-methyltransferase subunit A
VHNGSFSNHASIRRGLAYDGITCTTDNDSEVAARFIGRELSNGADLEDAMRMVLKEFDGFFTLLVTTANQFAVLRDSFACKPAVIAETNDYVAMASEYHALAELPGIGAARIVEPEPERVYAWSR